MSPKKNRLVKKLSINGQPNGFSVISRESLILVPDADNNKNGDKMEPKEIKVNGLTNGVVLNGNNNNDDNINGSSVVIYNRYQL